MQRKVVKSATFLEKIKKIIKFVLKLFFLM